MRLSHLQIIGVAALALGAGQGAAFSAAAPPPCFQPSPAAVVSQLRMRRLSAPPHQAEGAVSTPETAAFLPARLGGSCLVLARPDACSSAGFRGSRLPMSMSGTARRRRQGSAGAAPAPPTGLWGKTAALCVAAVKWMLALLRDIYGQFFVLVMDTLIQKPFLFWLNKVEIQEHKRLTGGYTRSH